MKMNSFEQRLARILDVERVSIDMDEDDMQLYVGPRETMSISKFKVYRVHSLVICDETTLEVNEPITIDVKDPG